MAPRIAIPVPHSTDQEFAERAMPQYERAVALAGGEPIRVPLDQSPAQVMKLIESCDGVLLTGSKADVDPARFGAAERSPHTAPADPARDTVDELLLQDAYTMRKPVLGICYGLQSLNVYRAGSLVQHIPDSLPEELRSKVDHAVGGKVAIAHEVEVMPDSRLAEIVSGDSHSQEPGAGRRKNPAPEGSRRAENKLIIPVNSSHHQSAERIGDGLRIGARCREDGVIESLEGTSSDHFVLAVQWHPERSVDNDEASRAIFRALVEAAAERHQRLAATRDGAR